MKDRLRAGLQRQRRHRLRDPVGDGGHAENSRAPSVRLGYLHRHHRGREIGPRRHPVPDLVEVVPQIGLEVLEGLPVHPGGTLVGLDSLYASHTSCFGISNGLSCGPDMPTRSPPGASPGCSRETNRQMSRPLRSTPITRASPLLRAGPPADAATVLSASRFPPRGALPLAAPALSAPGQQCRHPPSHVPCRSRRPDSRRLHAGHRLASKRAPARLIPGPFNRPGFDVICLFRHVVSGSLTLAFPVPT